MSGCVGARDEVHTGATAEMRQFIPFEFLFKSIQCMNTEFFQCVDGFLG